MNEIINFLTQGKGYKIVNKGTAPHFMFNFGNKSEKYNDNDFIITIWFHVDINGNPKKDNKIANVEITENLEAQCYFNGIIRNLSDFQLIFELVFSEKE